MNPFNFGPLEMVFIVVVLLLVFGAKRLPELGSGLGRGIREFRNSMRDINSEFKESENPNRIHEPVQQRAQVRSAAEKESVGREEQV